MLRVFVQRERLKRYHQRGECVKCTNVVYSLERTWKQEGMVHPMVHPSRTAFMDYCPDRFFSATRLLFLVFPFFR